MAPPVRFEVVRFSAAPASADVALLELEGRFSAPARRRLGAPRLLAEEGSSRVEVRAAEGGAATAEPDGAPWRASYAVPLRLLESGSFALAVGRELLVDLPDPDSEERTNGSSDVHVRLAREANALRKRADEAREAAAAALARADDERGARERTEAELRGQRHAREELATRLAQFESELAGRDETIDTLRREHEAELAQREEAFRERTDERVREAEAESAELRRALKSARADIEVLRRERDRAAERATSAVRTAAAPAAPPGPPRDEGPHPEQGVATPPLPLPEGESVGRARPAPRSADADPTTVAPGEHPTTVARGDREGGRDDPATVGDEGAAPEGRGDEPTMVARGDGNGDGDDPTTAGDRAAAAGPGRRSSAALDETTATLESAPNGALGDESEGVRVLGRRPPRARSGQEPPSEPLPGTAEIGARHITPGAVGRGGLGPWLARAVAILALAAVVAAVLLVVLGLR